MRHLRPLAAALVLLAATPAAADTLLVGNKGEDTLSFIDLTTAKERARVPTGKMPHEIAISPDGQLAAVVAYGGKTIDVFDVASANKLRTIDIAPNARPHGLVWLSDGRLVASAEGSKSIAVIAPGGKVTGVSTDQLGTHMVAVSPDRRRVFTANIHSGSVSVIDLASAKKLADIAVGGKPEGIALGTDGKRLWVGDLSAPRLQVYDTRTFKKLGEVAIDPVAIRVAASPDGKWIVTSNIGAGTLSIVDARTMKLARTIAVGNKDSGQVTILFSRDGRRLYVAETALDRVAEVDMTAGEVLRRIPVGKNGDGLAIAP